MPIKGRLRTAVLAPVLLVACVGHRPAATDSARPPLAVTLARDGYVARQVEGHTLYCRSELPTGTLLRTQACRTGEQIDAERQATEGTADALRRTRGVDCSGRQGPCEH